MVPAGGQDHLVRVHDPEGQLRSANSHKSFRYIGLRLVLRSIKYRELGHILYLNIIFFLHSIAIRIHLVQRQEAFIEGQEALGGEPAPPIRRWR